jgi:hypothetical protein
MSSLTPHGAWAPPNVRQEMPDRLAPETAAAESHPNGWLPTAQMSAASGRANG